ncbi:CYTH and CHAD domain-containing protein [Roseomonas populi]|uniref:CHAD domain-containing protein n=1 Tax=Roseomonas populi TaxID=3121582 RepID=A0ABT1XCK7_9PROT|nr:CHAD domain-containing protein [Roseomonas pecuniae]MCR0985835.1 CHAD domain-containing protein [Roseomonas pecuniae]
MTAQTGPRPTELPTELEVKFQLPPGTDATIASHPALASAEPALSEQEETTTYFDTPDRAFLRSGASLRVRRIGRRRVQTLKLRDGLGPFSRGEWEWSVPADRPELAHLASTPLAGLAGSTEGVSAVFTAQVRRSEWLLRTDGAVIAVTLDLGAIRTGEAEEPICELELELKEGEALRLLRLAQALQRSMPLLLGAESKSDRGWRLLTGEPRPVEKAQDPVLPEGTSAAEAFRRLTGATLATLVANQPAATSGMVEGVHAMRVAIRRLRALLALFRPHLAEEPEERFTAELRALGQVLGEARDWDVFCTQTLVQTLDDGVDETLIVPLREAALERRMEAHERLRAELRTPRLTGLILGLVTWAEDPAALSGEADGGALAEPLVDLAPELERRLARQVRRRGRRIRHRSVEELHDLRKALKKLRYAVEFLAPLHKPGQLKSFLRRCKRMQEQLGSLNDAVVTVSLAEQLGADKDAVAPAVEALRSWAERQHERSDAHRRKAWRCFKDAGLPAIGAA